MQYIESLKTSPKNLETEITIINLFCDGASVCFRPKGYNIFINIIYNEKLDGVTEITVQNEILQYIFNNLISGHLFEIYQDITTKKVYIYIYLKLFYNKNIIYYIYYINY